MLDWLRRRLGIAPGIPRVATDTSPLKMYSVRRHQALHRHRTDYGPDAPSPFSTPAFGLLMEMGYPGVTVTVVAFAGGTTSLYMSNGFMVEGGESYENVLQANTPFIETANHFLEYLEPCESFPIPETWRINFYALTDAGILGADVTMADLNKDRHELSPLFHTGRKVFDELMWLAKRKETEELFDVISAYDSEIAAKPGNVKLYCARADAYAALQMFDKALADYDKAASLKPNDPDLIIARGCFYASMGDLPASLADFDRVIALNPRDAMAYSNRGASYSKMGDVHRAIAEYGIAIEHDPRYPNSYANRAYAYYKLGEYEKGIADCNKALSLRPDHANTYNNRGHCRAAIGDVQGASADYQMALALCDCSCEAVEEALSGLQALVQNTVR